MRILLFTLEYPPFKGGIANYYGNLIKHWPEPDKIFILHNNQGRLIKNWLLPKWLLAIWHLRKNIKKNKIGHVLVGHILPLGTATYLIFKINKVKYSVFLHGMDFTFAIKSPRKRWLTKKILKNTANIICANAYTAKLVKDFLKTDITNNTIKVINPGINSQATRNTRLGARQVQHETRIKERYNLENKFVLLTVGRLVKRKGMDTVLASLPATLKQVPNLVYVIVGNGPELTNIQSLITKLKLEKNVIIITNADDKERNVWYNICDIFIMPARNIDGDFEGFGIVYLEANLTSKPVIAGDSGGIRDAVVNGLNGLLVNPESTKEITKAIIRLAHDKNLREKLGEQGRQRAIKEFSWEKQVKKIYNIIK